MQRRSTRTVFSILLILVASSVFAFDVPVVKESTITVLPNKYCVIKFPFKVTHIQLGTFEYKAKVKKETTTALNDNKINRISLSSKSGTHSAKPKNSNFLNIKKIDNMITLRPKKKGRTQIIVWGNANFPMIININVGENGYQNIDYIQMVSNRESVIKFEQNPHERIIELIMRYLYNPVVNKKPSGYDIVTKKEIYDVAIKDRNNKPFAKFRATLIKQINGRLYQGEVWNVNIVPEFNTKEETIEVPDGFKLKLYPEMFDAPGVYAVSLETYSITKAHGTRVMIVRKREGKDE